VASEKVVSEKVASEKVALEIMKASAEGALAEEVVEALTEKEALEAVAVALEAAEVIMVGTKVPETTSTMKTTKILLIERVPTTHLMSSKEKEKKVLKEASIMKSITKAQAIVAVKEE
jgi:hypothetical protein